MCQVVSAVLLLTQLSFCSSGESLLGDIVVGARLPLALVPHQ